MIQQHKALTYADEKDIQRKLAWNEANVWQHLLQWVNLNGHWLHLWMSKWTIITKKISSTASSLSAVAKLRSQLNISITISWFRILLFWLRSSHPSYGVQLTCLSMTNFTQPYLFYHTSLTIFYVVFVKGFL